MHRSLESITPRARTRMVETLCCVAGIAILLLPTPPAWSDQIPITSIEAFSNGRTLNDLPRNAIDGDIKTFTLTTHPNSTASPPHLAIGFSSTAVQRIRFGIANLGSTPGATAADAGVARAGMERVVVTLAVVTSVADGNWSAPATWGGGVPGPTDEVVIADGTTVTIDTSPTVAKLTVGQGISGTLEFEAATARTLTVTGDVTIAAGGTLRSSNAGTVTDHLLSLGGSLVNDGTLDLSTNSNSAGAGIRFTGAGSATFGGIGPTTDIFGPLTVDKGSSIASQLELVPSTFTFQGLATTPPTTGAFLVIANGVFKISGTYSSSNGLFAGTGDYIIPATGGLWLNNPNYTVAGRNGTMTLRGTLRVDAGALEVGSAPDNSITYAAGSSVVINGGTIDVAGRFSSTSDSAAISYTQTGGTLTVVTVGSTSTTLAGFDISNGASSFTMSGGSIVNQLAASGTDYRNVAGGLSITGGVLQLGNVESGPAKEYRLHGHVPNLLVTNLSANHSARLIGQMIAALDVTISPGTSVIMHTATLIPQTWSQVGPSIVNHGAIIGHVTGTRLSFSGSAPQNYSGTGTTGTAALPHAGISIANAAGVTLGLASPKLVTSRVNLFSGTLINSGQIQLGGGPASNVTTQIGTVGGVIPGGHYDTWPTFDFGSYSILYVHESVPRTTGFEIPPNRTANHVRVQNTNHLTLASGDLTVIGSLTLTDGRVTTGSNTVIMPAAGSVVRTNGYVNGFFRKGVGTGSPVTRLFEIGDGTSYTPVAVTFAAVTGAGALTASTAPGDHAEIATSGIIATKSVNRTWTLVNSGVAFTTYDAIYNFVAGDVDPSASPANFDVRKYDSPSWSSTTVGTRTPTSTQATGMTSFSDYQIGELENATSVMDQAPEFGLGSVSPNPSHGWARIEYSVGRQSAVRLSVLDLQGREVAVLASRVTPAGRHQAAWNGRAKQGSSPPGIYFLRYVVPGRIFVRRLVRLM